MNWIDKEQVDAIKRFHTDMERLFLFTDWNIHDKRKKSKRDLKWAWIKVGNTRRLSMIDPQTPSVAYKVEGYNATEMTHPKFTFERWATSFDL